MNSIYLKLTLAIIIQSLTPIFISIILNSQNSLTIAFIRIFFTFFVLLFIIIITYNFNLLKDFKISYAIIGFFEPGINSLLYVYAQKFINTTNTFLIISIYPFIQIYLEKLVFNSKLNSYNILFSLISFSGIAFYLILSDSELSYSIFGNLLLLFVIINTSIYHVFTKKYLKLNSSTLKFTFFQFSGSFLAILIILLYNYKNNYVFNFLPLKDSLILFYLCISMIIPFFLYNDTIKKTNLHLISLNMTLVIPLGFLWSYLILDEKLELYKLFSACLVILGIVLSNKFSNLKDKNE